MSSRKICVLRLDRLGDTICSTPALSALRNALPDAEIELVASKIGAQALSGNTDIDSLIVYEPSEHSIRENISFGLELGKKHFDTVIAMSDKFWPRFWSVLTQAKVRVGFDYGDKQPLKSMFLPLSFTHRINEDRINRDRILHTVERYMELLRPLNVESHAGPCKLELTDYDREWARGRVENSSGKKIVCLHLSDKWRGQGWNADLPSRVVESLHEKFENVEVVVTYSDYESEYAEKIGKELTDAGSTLVHCTSFGGWAALLELSSLVITMDTSASHVASAVGTSVVDIFYDDNFDRLSQVWSPWQVDSRLIRRERFRGDIRLVKNFVDEVIQAAKELI